MSIVPSQQYLWKTVQNFGGRICGSGAQRKPIPKFRGTEEFVPKGRYAHAVHALGTTRTRTVRRGRPARTTKMKAQTGRGRRTSFLPRRSQRRERRRTWGRYGEG